MNVEQIIEVFDSQLKNRNNKELCEAYLELIDLLKKEIAEYSWIDSGRTLTCRRFAENLLAILLKQV